jgi:hypothetical protein
MYARVFNGNYFAFFSSQIVLGGLPGCALFGRRPVTAAIPGNAGTGSERQASPLPCFQGHEPQFVFISSKVASIPECSIR